MFHPGWRDQGLSHLAKGFDVVVVGGGITGCGIALEAAQRGLTCLLLERDDIAAGTSSRSSKLIHGGLRYLKQMQFRVTRTACRERDRLLALSPHLVEPIRFLYPAYHGDRMPGWKVDLGLWMYDRLTSRPEKHDQLDAAAVGALAPALELRDFERAFAYTDAMADDARLTLAVAATAFSFGALVLTRCAAEEALRDPNGRVCGVVARDLVSGTPHPVSARVVVNATGVWTDVMRERMGLTGRRVRPSRGIHLVLSSHLLALKAAVTLPSPDDGRPVFFIPHPEGVLVGTTDIYHDGPLDDPRPTAAEIDYLLRVVGSAFPDLGVGRAQVLGTFAGLRPILDTHAEDPSEASREEDIWEEDGLLSVAGGKLTTWRATAEEAMDEVLKRLPEDVARHTAPSASSGTPLAGLAPHDLASRLAVAGVTPSVAAGMARRLGALVWPALQLARRRRELEPLAPGLDLCAAEVRAHLRWSAVLHLEDLLLRRVRLGMWQPGEVPALLSRLRPVVKSETGWKFRRWDTEVERLQQALAGWTLEGAR